MTGWIDPLGLHTLFQYIDREQKRLEALIDEQARMYPKGRKAARYRGRRGELGRLMRMLQALQRPGKELQPHKDLLQGGSDERRYLTRRLAALAPD